MVTPTDTFYSSQWHFNLIGDIETIWDEFTGTGVNLGIYSDGVQSTHSDLDGNYNSVLTIMDGSGTAVSGLPDLSLNAGFGTSVAGIIAAEHNANGTVGIAFDAAITGVNILNSTSYGYVNYTTGVGQAASLDVISQARGFDIMVNPWDNAPSFNASQNPANTSTFDYQYLEQIQQNLIEGRSGLGTIVVHASGDDGTDANGSGVNASRYTLSVAATDIAGNATIAANFGSSILMAAPAAAYTTDLVGNDGFNRIGTSEPINSDPLLDTDFTSVFGGTSAATAVVSGVIALMLEANPNLGWRDVQNTLAISASHTGSNLGANTVASEQGDWEINGAQNWNGGGLSFNGSYGFGMIDAYAAVRMAEAWTPIYTTPLTSINEVPIQTLHTNISGGSALPVNGDEVSFEIVSTIDISIEHIQQI